MTESGEDVVQSVDEADTIDSSLLRITECRKDATQSVDEADTIDSSQLRMTESHKDVVQSVDEVDKDPSQNSLKYLQSISSSKTENTTTEESFTQAQTPVKYNLPVSVSLRQRIRIRGYKDLFITSCVKIGNTLMFTDNNNDRLIICNSDGTDIHDIPLPYKPYYMTEIDSNTVAVSSRYPSTIMIINISTRSVTSTIGPSIFCLYKAISYNDNNLYVVINKRIIHVMDLRGNVLRTISVLTRGITDITIDKDRLVCTDTRSIYCYSLDGTLIWITKKEDNTENYSRVTTDNKGNVYATDYGANKVEVIYDKGQHQGKLLTLANGIIGPYGIFFDKRENILLVCSHRYGVGWLFDVKDK